MLDIKGLTVSYGRETVLEDINLEIKPGESLAIIGESGTGKTTLALSIMRLVEGSVGGSICFDGQDLLQLDEEQMRQLRWRQIAIAFQNANNVLNPVYDVLPQVTEPMIQHRLADKNEASNKAKELLTRFGLPEDRFGAFPHQLSGGEQQIVLLTMALANEPRLLILDEPLSSLDAATRASVGKLLEDMDGQRCRLITSHDLDTASSLSQRLAVLYGGRIVETGPTEELLSEPRHPYTRALIRAYPNMTTVKDLQGIKGRLMRGVGGCPFHPRCTQAIDICRSQIPPLAGDGPRQVACHRGGIITLLATENLTKSFGQLKAVDGVDLHILAGETLALVGQTGSGKTTLAKTIMGLHPATSGDVYVEGVRVNERNQDFYRKVQMVFQNPGESLSHRLSVVEAAMEPLDVHGIGSREERYQKAVKVIGEVELSQEERFLHTYPHHLSGGELQRLAIARALVLDPMLIIADEPTAFLDASIQAKVLKLLLNLQEQRGLSLLYITHDIAAARKVSDRIAVMLDGKIVEQGPSNRIITQPVHEYTRRLLTTAAALHRSDNAG